MATDGAFQQPQSFPVEKVSWALSGVTFALLLVGVGVIRYLSGDARPPVIEDRPAVRTGTRLSVPDAVTEHPRILQPLETSQQIMSLDNRPADATPAAFQQGIQVEETAWRPEGALR